MSNGLEIFVLFGVMLVLVLAGVPIAVSLGLSSLVMLFAIGVPLTSAVQALQSPVHDKILLVIPLFIFVASLMNESGVTQGLVEFVDRLVGGIHGALGYVTVVTNMIMAGITGTANADMAALGKIFIPAMIEKKYENEFAVAITVVSATIGAVLPPSVTLVVWAAFTNTSVGGLFLGGVIPGVAVGLGVMFYIWLMARRMGLPPGTRSQLREKAAAFVRAFAVFPVPLLIVGGIVRGWFAPGESAVAAIVYMVIVFGLLGRLRLSPILRATRGAIDLLGPVLFTIANAMLFGWTLSYLGFSRLVGAEFVRLHASPPVFLAVVVAVFFLLGGLMSTVEVIVIFGPTVAAVGSSMQVNPILLGVIAVCTLALGLAKPPDGLCLLLGCQIGETSVVDSFYRIAPLLAVELIIIGCLIIVPQSVLWLPRLFLPGG